MINPVHVIGASGRSGAAVCRALAGREIPLVRDAARWAATGFGGAARVADLTDPEALTTVLADASLIVSCAHARHTPAILQAAPPDARLVLLGSTRKFSRWRDSHGDGVRAGEAAFLASGRRGVMLHPTMIYGAQGEDNVRRLAAWLVRLPFVPLPAGGRSLVQPIHQSDVTRAVMAAVDRDWPGPHTLVIAGPTALTYADFVRAIARAAGLGTRPVAAIPASVIQVAAWVSRRVPGVPSIGADEVRRLLEDKAFDVAPMRAVLGFAPMSLEAGLAMTFQQNN